MLKIIQLEKGSIFANKGGALVYLTNEQLNKTGRVLNRETQQIENKPDLDMQKLRIQQPIESNISGLLALGLQDVLAGGTETGETPAQKAAKTRAAKKAAAAAGEETK